MRFRLHSLKLVTATLLLFSSSVLQPTATSLGISAASAQAQTNQDRKAESLRLYQEGRKQYNQGQLQKALQTFQQVLAIVREIGERKGEGATLTDIGLVYQSLGQYPKALDFYQQALVIKKEIGDKAGVGTTLNNIGGVYDSLGQYPKALEFYQQALVIEKEVGDKAGVGTTLNNIGEVYDSLGQYPKALEFFSQALITHKEVDDRSGVGTTLNNIGGVYDSLGQYPKALEFYQQALVIKKEIGDRVGVGATLNNIGGVYNSLGQYPKALEFYQQALVIKKEIGNRAGVGTTLSNIGVVYYSLGEYPKALEFFSQALIIRKQIGDRTGEGATLNNIGLVYTSLGQYPKGLEFFSQALVIRKEIGDRTGVGTTLHNIGGVYDSLGQYPKALEFYQQALAIRKEVGDRSGVGQTLNNVGAVYRSLGQYPKALEFYQQALAIRKEVGDRSGEGATLSNIGVVYQSLGQYPKALEFFSQALVIEKEIGDKAGVGTTLNNIGAVYISLGQYPKALEVSQQALVIEKEIGDMANVGTTLNNIGELYRSLGQYPKALDFAQQALAIRREVGDRSGVGQTLNNIGAVYNSLGQYADAEKNLFSAIEVKESLRPGLTDAQKVSIFETQADTYRFLQDALVAQNKTNTALEIAERGRARAFVELIASKLSANSNNQINIKPPTLQQIQQIAREQNATLVEYSVMGNDALYIWVIKPTGEIAFQQVDLKSLKTPLKDLVTLSRNSLGVRGRGGLGVIGRNDETTQIQRLQPLHQLLIQPIAQYLPTEPNQRIIFIPQGALFLVPFPALKDGAGKYLIEQHTILTAPSIQVLQLTREKQQRLSTQTPNQGGAKSQQDVLVVGNPTMPSITTKLGDTPQSLPSLPGAETEAISIAQILKTKAIVGNQATKTAIMQKMNSARIIHLATHGLLDDFKGLGVPGAIALAPSGTGELNDGLLTSNDILDMNLNAQLVVLSACDTGRGDITGDGVIGLSRSLITAGVESVIVSLWSVPDAPTGELMTEFYRQLGQNPNKATALRNAMLTTMKNHPEPVNWAAFTLIGEAE